MSITPPVTAPESLEALRNIKRKIYFIVLPVGLVAAVMNWVIKEMTGAITPVDRIVYPLAIVYLLTLMAILWKKRGAFQWIEVLLYAGVVLSLLAEFHEILSRDHLHEHYISLANLLYWFPIGYVLAYLMFETRGSVIASAIFFLAVSGPSLAQGVAEMRQGDLTEFNLLTRFVLANAIYPALLFAVTWLKTRYEHLRTQAEVMTHLAHTDALVDIPNRRQIDNILRKEIYRAQRYGHALSVILFDIDHFKRVNDTFGHAAGDEVLKTISLLVKQNIRPSDEVGRWGGEEFLIIVPETLPPHAWPMAERLRQLIANRDLEKVGRVTVSFGIAAFRAGDTPQLLLQRADEALYRAKQAGRNRVEMND